MEFSAFQRLLDIVPTQEEKLAVARMIDSGARTVSGSPYITAPFVLVDRVRENYPELRRRKDVEILYDPMSHAVWLGQVKPVVPLVNIPPAATLEKVTLS